MYYVFSQKEEGDGPQQRIFQFDKVHDSSTGNEEVHRVLSLPAVELSMEGFNVSIFCYGQTGAGKTHTMIGVDDDPGLIYRTMDTLCEACSKQVQPPFQGLCSGKMLDVRT